MRVTMLITALALFTCTFDASACDCAAPPAADKALEGAAAVFLGKATEVKVKDGFRITTFRIKRTWKGTQGQTVVVKTTEHGSECGYLFKEGEQYLVYCHRDPSQKELLTDICSRTCTKNESTKDLKVIGKGKKPAK